MKFASGKEYNILLHRHIVLSSFYSQEDIYSIEQPQSWAILDVALAKGGLEAIAESYLIAAWEHSNSLGVNQMRHFPEEWNITGVYPH